MKDKYLGMVLMAIVAAMCIVFKTTYASEIVTLLRCSCGCHKRLNALRNKGE